MTQEEKAKRYDEAIQRAGQFMKTPYLENSDDVVGFIFPELKDSEDERIRKSLIDMLKNDEKHYLKEIAWLEKQKTSEEALQYLRENHSSSEMSDFQVAMNIAVAKAYDKGYNDGLEKQGEQKPVIVPKFREGDIIKHKDTNETFEVSKIEIFDADEIYYHLTNGCCVCENSDNFELVEQKPAWSEEDINMFGSILSTLCICANNPQIPADVRSIHKKEESWFNELYHRVQPQPQQEWGEGGANEGRNN